MASNETSLPSEERTIQKLLLIYSADSGRLAALIDSARKLLTINGCSLCSITHGLAGEKADWKDCREELGVEVDYVHRDEVRAELRELVGDALPCIVAVADGDLIPLLGPDVLRRCRGSVEDLRGRLGYFASIKQLRFPTPLS